MVNHFSTLLLNLPSDITIDQSFLVSPEFNGLSLPQALQSFHAVLFPAGASRYYKQFLAFCYLRILQSTNITTTLYKFDNRIMYNLDEIEEFFNLNRKSNPVSYAPGYNLLVFGNYNTSAAANYYYNNYQVQQVANGDVVTIYSYIDKKYLKGKEQFDNPVASSYNTVSIDSVDSNLSDAIFIADTGLSFRLTGPLGSFSSTSNKRWEFFVEAPFRFDINNLMLTLQQNIGIVDKMLNYGRNDESVDASNQNLWTGHFNDLYKFAGLLNAYVERVNVVWQNQT